MNLKKDLEKELKKRQLASKQSASQLEIQWQKEHIYMSLQGTKDTYPIHRRTHGLRSWCGAAYSMLTMIACWMH